MHYYKHHIGDYRRDTGHLSLLEHGVYRQLLDWYYLEESPIPLETHSVYRRLSARTEPEMRAVDAVLADFFTKTAAGWINGRCDSEIGKYQDDSEKNRENGKRGGRPKKTQSVSVGFDLGTQEEPNNNPDITLTINHKPLTNNQEENQKLSSPANAVDPCPHEEIIALYHQHLPMLTQVRVWNDKRKSLLRSRWREDASRQNLEWWDEFFRYVASCPFLCGKGAPRNGQAPWQADLEWLVNPSNMTKVIEGKYQEIAA